MRKHDEVQERLEQIGRLPVPQPRSEFVESLLPRIHMLGDLAPSDVPRVGERSHWARLRMVAVGSAAAIILGAVGFLAASQNGPSQDIATIRMSNGTQAEVAGGLDISEGAIVVCEEIELVADDRDPCAISARFEVQDNKLFPIGDSQPAVPSFTDDGYVTVPESTRGNEVATGPADQPAPTIPPALTTTEAPTTSPAPAAAAATEAPATTTTTAEIVKPTPTPIEGEATPAPRPDGVVAFALEHEINGDGVTLTWDDYPYDDFGSYVVVRTVSAGDLKPDTPAYPARGGAEQLAVFAQTTTYGETVPDGATWVAYKVAVLDPAGEMVGLSTEALFRIEYIDESQLSPSGQPSEPVAESGPEVLEEPELEPAAE